MKKLRIFLSVFLGLLILVGVVRYLSEEKINAKKSMKLILEDFKIADSTKIDVFYYRDGELVKQIDLEEDSISFLRLFHKIMTTYVYSSDFLEDSKPIYSSYDRVKLANKDVTCQIDFPIDESPYEVAVIEYVNQSGGGIFHLSKNGSEKIKFLLGH